MAGRKLSRVRAADAELRGHSLSRLRELESWVVDEAKAHVEAGTLHLLLTRVVDETQAICEEIGRELFGYPAQTGETAPGR